jgi:GntR family transcriptional regulator
MENLSRFQPFTPISGDNYDSTTLAQRVAEQLRALIMEGTLSPETQLPNEPDLSAFLNVSRSTVRSAFTILEQGGFIQRRWGVGTFIAKNPPTYNNLSLNSGVTQLIRSSGAEAGYAELLITTRPASEHIANRLSLEPGAPILVLERVRLANDRRVVFCQDMLPMALFRNQDGVIPLHEVEQYIRENQSMYAFIRERLSKDIHHGVAWIQPLSAESYLAEKLSIPRGTSVLRLEQVDYGDDGEPIALADEYYVADAFTFYIYRSS